MPERLRRNCAAVQALPAELCAHFDNRGMLALFGALHRRAFAGRAATDDYDVVSGQGTCQVRICQPVCLSGFMFLLS